jgi:hypothetical protein
MLLASSQRSTNHQVPFACISIVSVLLLSCTSSRLYYVQSELPTVDGDFTVGPGPWPQVPAVVSDEATPPDDLVIPMLQALTALPGAADSCDLYGKPRPDAAEYCVAVYKTAEDWRVTWPMRKLSEAHSSCRPPFGGVADVDFGRDLPVFGYAHNHNCGLFASSRDLTNFPAMKSPASGWVLVSYAVTPGGQPALDSQGQLIPAWGWLATGHADAPRFYKWNSVGEVFKWSEHKKQWEFQATCKPQVSKMLYPDQALPPSCSPELVDWY